MAAVSKAGDSNDDSAQTTSYYLMKAEPDSRIVKGKDVKFSVDDFEAAQTTAWEGVRNYEARNIMQGMKVGDKVLFYHSNTKNPGIAGFAEVSRQAYPDSTAFDQGHPYYDAKSNPSSPKWYMVDLRFVSRIPHFISLCLLRHLAQLSNSPQEMPYLSADDLEAIGSMALLNKGRLSVQKVEEEAWHAVSKIAKEGDGGIVIKRMTKSAPQAQDSRGYENHGESDGDEDFGSKKTKGKRKSQGNAKGTRKPKRSRK